MSELAETVALSRRSLLKAGALAGGGLFLSATLPGIARAATGAAAASELNAYVSIASDGLVTIVMSGTRRLSGWTAPHSRLADRMYDRLLQIGPAAFVGLSSDAPSTAHVRRAHNEARLALDFASFGNRVMPYASIPFRQMVIRHLRDNAQLALPAWVGDLREADLRSRNVLRRNGAGVAVMYTKRVEMTDNRFEDNWGSAAYGLLLKDITDSEIRGNTFVRNTVALYAEGVNRTTVEGNTFEANGWADFYRTGDEAQAKVRDFHDMIADRAHMRVGPSRGDEKEVRSSRHFPQVEKRDVHRLPVEEQLCGAGEHPVERRPGRGLCRPGGVRRGRAPS